MNLSIIVPCFNEAENGTKLHNELLPVLRELAQDNSLELVFIDDGSTDGTLESLKSAFGSLDIDHVSIKLVKHPTNRGVGAALRTGFASVSGDIIVTTDSDGTYKFSNIPALLACLTKDVYIVTASPYHPNGGVVGVPRVRLILSQGSSLLYRLLVQWNIHTYTSLFRAYRRQAVENITIQADGFLAISEILVKSIFQGCRVAEYPAVLYSRTHGVSKIKLVRTIKSHLIFLFIILLHRLHLKPINDGARANDFRQQKVNNFAVFEKNGK